MVGMVKAFIAADDRERARIDARNTLIYSILFFCSLMQLQKVKVTHALTFRT